MSTRWMVGLAILCLGFELAANMILVRDGQSTAAIVIPDKPLPCHEVAAQELSYHVEKASGAKLPVFKESELTGNNENLIFLGDCKATKEAGIDCKKMSPSEYLIKSVGNRLFIAGSDRSNDGTIKGVGSPWYANFQGTLWGVYELLEREMGVRWLFPGEDGEVIPANKNIVISDKSYTGKPKLLYTNLVQANFPQHRMAWSSKEACDAFMAAQRRFLLRHRFGSVVNMNYSHNFSYYWERFGSKHPDFFALVNPGVRKPLDQDHKGRQISLCLSNPELHKQIVDDWESRPEADRTLRPFLNVCLNDTPEMCKCDNCRAWDAADPNFATSEYWGGNKVLNHGSCWEISKAAWGEANASQRTQPSLSDRYAKFCLAVQQEARKADPDVTLVGFIYTNYTSPPVETKLNDKIILMNVYGLWFPYTSEMSEGFRKNWLAWQEAGVKQYYRPNLLHAGANLPIFYAREFAADFNFAYRNGMLASDMDSLLGAFATQGPTLYTVARMHFNPELTVDEILDEYYSGFGSAKNEVQKYFEFWENHSKSLTAEKVDRFRDENRDANGAKTGGFMNYVMIAHEICPPEKIAEAKKLLDQAANAARLSPSDLKKVEYLQKGLREAELTVNMRLAQIARKKNPDSANHRAYKKAFQDLKQYRQSVEADFIGNFGVWAFREHYGANWPWEIEKN